MIDDLDVLKTLPRREFNQGFAEIIKHAIIADPKMFKTASIVEGILYVYPLVVKQLV